MSAPAWDRVFRRGDRGRTRGGQKYRVVHVEKSADDTQPVLAILGASQTCWFQRNGRLSLRGNLRQEDLLPPTKRRKPKPAPAAEVAKVALPWSEELFNNEWRVSAPSGFVFCGASFSSDLPLRPRDARRLAAALLAAADKAVADAAEALAPAPAEPPAPAPLVLRVGGVYRTRDGRRAVLGFDDGDQMGAQYPLRGLIYGKNGVATWTTEGRTLSNGQDSGNDLIAEWTDTGATS